MGDLKAYIESGVLELYVLGSLSDSERAEVDLMLEKHPELRLEMFDMEKALQKYAEAEAIEPSESLRSKVLSALETKDETEIPTIAIKHNNFYKYAFAASVALLLLSLVALVNLRSELKESNSKIAVLQQSNQQFSSRVNFVEGQLSSAKQSLEVFHNPEKYTLVNLKGTENAPAASLTVAFDKQKSEVMIDLASLKMPANDSQHQYQLWALVDGKPVDLGVFDVQKDSLGMQTMKSIQNAQAFAVTLEPKGGSINPTMDKMMAMGEI